MSCPASASFLELHFALQAAFGWATSHTFDFKIRDPNAPPEAELDIAQYIERVKASLGQGPPVPAGPRQNFLRIVQDNVIFAVDGMHNGVRMHPETPELTASRVKLGKIFDKYPAALVEYEYDFGDCWEHEITIVGRESATDVFVCTDGEGHGVAEDVGSVDRWQALKEAYRSRDPTEEQKEKMEWFERLASNHDTRGLRDGRDRIWDRDGVNFKLRRM
jgi:Plasmid pRiA4b ORF-3-like protein